MPSTHRMDDLFNLTWKDFPSNLSQTFKDIKDDNDLHDVTLVCDDGELNAHKLVLFSGSLFFQTVLKKSKHSHPLLYLKGVKIGQLKSIVDFMYNGEVSLAQDDLQEFINTAMDLNIKGLTEQEDKSLGNRLTMSQGSKNYESNTEKEDIAETEQKLNGARKQIKEETKEEMLTNEDIETKALGLMVKSIETNG